MSIHYWQKKSVIIVEYNVTRWEIDRHSPILPAFSKKIYVYSQIQNVSRYATSNVLMVVRIRMIKDVKYDPKTW